MVHEVRTEIIQVKIDRNAKLQELTENFEESLR